MNSGRILFLGLSYHKKTGSSGFIENLLEERFEVTKIYEQSWINKELATDYSSIPLGDYDAIIIWQIAYLLPDDFLRKLGKLNTVFFPMENYWDEWAVWNKYRKFKIISFSRYNYEKLKKWGFDVEYFQFYPKPNFVPFASGKEKFTVFFWQRVNAITWKEIKQLFNKDQIEKIILHNSVDPFNDFTMPSEADIRDYNIEITEWFDRKSDLEEKIAQADIYISPRLTEGIGFSFLEAMAMGKAVVAMNAPTMSEYIVHNKNGYLFNVFDIKKLDLTDIDKIRMECVSDVESGFRKWTKDKERIFEIIERDYNPNRELLNRQKRVGVIRVIVHKLRKLLRGLVPAIFMIVYRRYIKRDLMRIYAKRNRQDHYRN